MTAKGAERAARLTAIVLALGLPVAALIARWAGWGAGRDSVIEIHGALAEAGGWAPADLTATVGEPLRLRLTSDDVMHGFAVGQSDWPAVDVAPGEVTETTITFNRPGKYVFYCTRWCGVNHWRMRGTIEVAGPTTSPAIESPPLYVTLGLDLDAPHPADVIPERRPSADRGAEPGATIPVEFSTGEYFRAHSPAEVWRALRASPASRELADAEVWDVVAFVWRSNSTPESLVEGKRIYAANCAACHGESGAGDGVMAASLANLPTAEFGHGATNPADFTDAAKMLGASPALLQGKIIRGGMGTGMPYWGPILTESQTWAVLSYLWTFVMD
ncbi:MAG: c-type cytochrome [Chloroflexi bacterium]|nr:c-type cytochrome [Chloroflexota bacterium]